MPNYKVKREQLYVKGFFHPVWRLDIYVAMCNNRTRIKEFLIANHDGPADDIQTPAESSAASAYLVKRNDRLIPVIALPMVFDWKNSKHHSTLAHESVHVAIALHRMHGIYLPTCGHPPERWDDEGLCYTVDWVMDQCYEMILNKDKYKFKFSDEIAIKK
jgi:hypothetical protein